MEQKKPSLSVDAIVFDPKGRLLLVRRKYPPFKGRHALPGGFVEYGETVESAVARELFEETGLKLKSRRLVGVYSAPKRDPRGHNVSVAFLVGVAGGEPKAGDDAAAAHFVTDWQSKKLAFDHGQILADALRLMRT